MDRYTPPQVVPFTRTRSKRMKINTDKTRVRLDINAELTAAQLESLISDLAMTRAKMVPEVCRERPATDLSRHVSQQDDPDMEIVALGDGRIRFWIRHQGFGWFVVTLPAGKASAVRDYLIANTPEEPSILFGDEFADGDASH